MPELVLPTVDVHASFLEAMSEFTAEGRGGASDDSMIGRDLRELGATWHEPGVFAGYVARLCADRHEDTPRPPTWVPCTTWWWLDGACYLGRIALRHRLNEVLRDAGGHIGYDVRPSARRRGHATAMLRGAVAEAAARGIADALLTCDCDNLGSRRVIETCGGRLEDQRGRKLRYWIATALSPQAARS
jgi:predicted acetyltransferase